MAFVIVGAGTGGAIPLPGIADIEGVVAPTGFGAAAGRDTGVDAMDADGELTVDAAGVSFCPKSQPRSPAILTSHCCPPCVDHSVSRDTPD